MSITPTPEEHVAAAQAAAQTAIAPQVAIARIDATLLAIKNQIDHSERSSEQLVRLVNERFTARFDSLERRLDEMDRSREASRQESADASRRTDERLTAVEHWQQKISNRFIGMMVGVGLSGGGIGALLVKVFEKS